MKELSSDAQKILEQGYLRRDGLGRLVETPKDLFRRVAHAIASVEGVWSSLDEVDYYENEYYQMMLNLEFLPSLPTLMNSGKEKGQLASCFVLPVPDSIEGITQAVQQMMTLQKSGGGTGFSLSSLRPRQDSVVSTGGTASGPIEFLKVFDAATEAAQSEVESQKLHRATLRIDHPDILEFIRSKEEKGVKNFKLSVGITSHFMRCLKKNTTYPLVNPRNGKIVRFIPARETFEALCKTASTLGDPGLIFIDEINRHNPTPQMGKIEAITPWGEQPLLAFEACHLGSINLSNMVNHGEFDEERFEIVIDLAVRFLDNVIEANSYTFAEIERVTKLNRKIGLGVMGFAEMLLKLDIPYDTPKGRSYATSLMKLFLKRARQASVSLAKQRGPFPNYRGSNLEKLKLPPIRNATLTTLGHTQTLANIVGTTPGIEPLSKLISYSMDTQGKKVLIPQKVFKEKMEEAGFNELELFQQIAKTQSIQKIEKLPKKIRELFKTSHEIEPLDHIRMQGVFQKYIDNAVDKDITLSHESSWETVYKIYMAAYEAKCKSINLKLNSTSISAPDLKMDLEKSKGRSKKGRYGGKSNWKSGHGIHAT